MRSTHLRLAASALLGASLLLAACGTSSGGGGGTIVNGKGCKHIAFLLPESATAARWEAADHPDVVAAVQKYLPGAKVDAPNAQGNATTQQTQAESELTQGACILIVAPVDSSAAATIVTEAKAKNVPVIAYDRLIYTDSLNYYASFDGFSVGVAQGTYIKNNYQKYVTANGNNNMMMIDGSDTDNNAHLFGNGAHSILDPLITAGTLNKVYEQFTPGWDNATAQTEAQAALTAHHNQISVAYVMNDGMANTVIAALQKVGLAGKVLVTGQDAEVAGIRNILLGYQSMTVYKPITKLADSVGQLVAAISNGTDTSALANQKVKNPSGNAQIPSVLNAVVEVDITNIKTTVIADNFVKVSDVCQGVPSGTGGVCP
ncbi:MAG TPA: substrate-binding domain-containing protein [Ktedonobacterales bacterium]|nr:substrate-binding domain-containing protein [Ktedonobacterales bacterium]